MSLWECLWLAPWGPRGHQATSSGISRQFGAQTIEEAPGGKLRKAWESSVPHALVTLALPRRVHIHHLPGPRAHGMRLAECGEPPGRREGRSWATALTVQLWASFRSALSWLITWLDQHSPGWFLCMSLLESVLEQGPPPCHFLAFKLPPFLNFFLS